VTRASGNAIKICFGGADASAAPRWSLHPLRRQAELQSQDTIFLVFGALRVVYALASKVHDRRLVSMNNASRAVHAGAVRTRLLRLLLAAYAVMFGTPVLAESIRVGGTGSAIGTMRLLADAYLRKDSQVRLTVVPNLGSTGGLRALQAGAIDIAVISRLAKPEELGHALVAYEYGRSPFVLVSKDAKVRGLSLDNVADMIRSPTSQWPDGTPVRLVLRPVSDHDSALFASFSPQIADALRQARAREGLVVAASDQDAADAAERLSGALATNTLALVLSEKRRLHVLALDGVMPSVQALADARYPFFKPLSLVTRADATAPVQRFVAFVKSAEGRAILEANGHLVAR
jgi:phosphate transport system substrate-binding protein